MDLSIVSQFMSLDPDMMYKATKMVESAKVYFPGDVEAQEQYLNENLIDQTLEYALTLLEDKKVRDYMDIAVYTNGRTFSAPTLALYNVASMPEMKQRIQAKLNAKGGMKKEEAEILDEKKRPKLKGRKFNGKNPWWNSDGDDTPYEEGDDVKKTRKEAVDYVADLWRNRQLQEDETVDEAMRPGPRQRKLAAKQYQTYGVTTRDRANAHNIAVRGDGPGTPGYEKKSTGGKGARYAGYGDQGAGNKARRRQGLEPYRGSRDPRNEEFTIEAKNKEGKEQGLDGKACWKGYKQAGTKMKGGKRVDNCVKMEDVDFVADYLIAEGLNEYGIDILIEEMGLDDFCDFVDEISSEEFLVEWRRGAGGTKVRGSGMSKSGKPIGSLKGGAKASAIRGTAEHKARKAEREKESGSSGMTSALKSQSKIAKAKKSQPATKSTPTQTKEKAKGGILGALKTRAERDTKLLGKSLRTAGNVAARRAAEVAGVTVGVTNYIGKKMKKEERELLTHYFLESEIAFNYDEVQEIFESLDQEHFDYFLDQAMLMVEESGPSARELIEQKLQDTFDIERFTFADWRHLTEKNSDDVATSKFVKMTQTNRTDNTRDVNGKRKDGVIINPQIDMRSEDKDLENYQKSTQSSIDNVKKTKNKMVTRASASIAANRVERDVKTASKYGPQRQRPGTVGAYRTDEEVEHLDERRREDKGKPRPAEPSDAFKLVSKSMGASRLGVQPRGKKKEKGGPTPGPSITPAQKVANRRAARQRAQDNMSSRFD